MENSLFGCGKIVSFVLIDFPPVNDRVAVIFPWLCKYNIWIGNAKKIHGGNYLKDDFSQYDGGNLP